MFFYVMAIFTEVMKVLRAKKYAKMKKNQPADSIDRLQAQAEAEKQGSSGGGSEPERSELENNCQVNYLSQ